MTDKFIVTQALDHSDIRRGFTKIIFNSARSVTQHDFEVAFLTAIGEFSEFNQDRIFVWELDVDILKKLIDFREEIVDLAAITEKALEIYDSTPAAESVNELDNLITATKNLLNTILYDEKEE